MERKTKSPGRVDFKKTQISKTTNYVSENNKNNNNNDSGSGNILYILLICATLVLSEILFIRTMGFGSTPTQIVSFENKEEYFAAGVLPLAKCQEEGKWKVLLGFDQHTNQWADFGGLRESHETDPIQTACREFVEETMGTFSFLFFSFLFFLFSLFFFLFFFFSSIPLATIQTTTKFLIVSWLSQIVFLKVSLSTNSSPTS